MFARECLAEPSVDVTVQGQGEETFAEIVRRLGDGQLAAKAARAAPFVSPTARSARIRRARCNPLEKFRAHDYGLIPVERYFALKGKRQLDYISSQGCNFRCAFCSDPFVYGRKWVGLDPTRMALRLQELWDQYEFDDVNFQDETFFTRRDRVKALADQIVDSGMKITWAGTMRADQGVRLPDEVWERCKQSGLRRLLVGVESGSDEMLQAHTQGHQDRAGFPHGAEDARVRDRGPVSRSSSAFPDESDASITATLACAKRLRAMSPDFQTPIFYFKPYPGSDIVTEAVARGFRLPDTLEAWSRVRLRGRPAGALGFAGEIQAHRALQVLPRAGLEARVSRQALAAAARTLSLQPRRLSLAGRDAAHAVVAGRSRDCHERTAPHPADQSDDHLAPQRALSARGPEPRQPRSTASTRRSIIDGNVDRDFVATTLRALAEETRSMPWASP